MENVKKIGIVCEDISPENPGGLEKRVAVLPCDVKRLVQKGYDITIEHKLGHKLGLLDKDYSQQGAAIQSKSKIYKKKDMIIKFKNLSYEAICLIDRGTTLFCMAHVSAFKERTQKLQNKNINLIAMEEIFDNGLMNSSDKLYHLIAIRILKKMNTPMNIVLMDYQKRFGELVKTLNRSKKTLSFKVSNTQTGNNELVIYNQNKPITIYENNNYIDISEWEKLRYDSPPIYRIPKRIIQCLHETGQGGALLGLTSSKINNLDRIVILGYGNVANGAINQCFNSGYKNIHVLNKYNIKDIPVSKLYINGVDLPKEQKGKQFIITNKQFDNMDPGTTLIDLIGGNKLTRGAIEPMVENTFLNEPFKRFNKDKRISALWGFPCILDPMLSCEVYSKQITDVILNNTNYNLKHFFK